MALTKRTISSKLAELDRILNDPTAPMEAHRVWSLLDDISAGNGADEMGESVSGKSLRGRR